MPNGKEIASDLNFEQNIAKMADRELLEFVARQTLNHSKDLAVVKEDTKDTKNRSITNRWILIALVLVLMALGVIDSGILSVFAL